ALQYQAGQTDATARLENAFPGDVEAVHGFGQQPARGPDLAEMAPLGRGDAQAFAVAIGVGELLAVAEYAQAVAVRADRHREGTGVVAGHEGLPEGASILPDRAWEGATGGPV